MAQQTRTIQRIFGETGETSAFAQIGSANAGVPLLTKDLTTIQNLAQYLTGLVGVVVNQGDTGLPRLEDINSLYFLVTSQLAYIFQNGIPEWLNSTDQRYYANVSFVQVNGDVYQAILGDDATNINAQRNPTTEPTWWRLIRTPTERGLAIGDIVYNSGNAQPPSASFPRFCLTNFTGSTDVLDTNYPEYVPWLRSQQVIYLEGQPGQTTEFTGTVAGSVLTLDNNTANVDVIAALNEDQLSFGSFTEWRTVDIDGVTYDITALNADPGVRTITVNGTPTVGVQNATFYPHRIAGTTLDARIHSWRGRSPIGAGTEDTIIGLMRRDRFQGHWHEVGASSNVGTNFLQVTSNTGSAQFVNTNSVRTPITDTINGTPRTGLDTHGPDVGVHIYQYVGRFIA